LGRYVGCEWQAARSEVRRMAEVRRLMGRGI